MLLRPLLVLLITVFVLTGTGMLVLFTQQERLIQAAVAELNTQLRGELILKGSSISPFKHFPYLSIALHDVEFYCDKEKSGKPAFAFERVYAGISLPDLLKQRYNVRKLVMRGGNIELIRENDGSLNIIKGFEFLSDSVKAPSAQRSAMDVMLEKVVIKAIEFSFVDRESDNRYSSSMSDVIASFRMDSSQVAATVNGDMELNFLSKDDTTFFRHKKIHLDLEGLYALAEKQVTLKRAAVKLEEASFKAEGNATLSDVPVVDFRVTGDKPDFTLIAAFIPDDVKAKLKPFRYNGVTYFDALIKGAVSGNQLPLLEVSFGCKDAWFHNTEANKKVDQLGFKGFYTNGAEHSLRTSELHITGVKARPEKGVFEGNFVMQDFTNPRTLVQVRSELELKFLGEFFGIPGLQQITGKIKLNMDFKELTNVKLPEESLNKLKEGIQSSLSVEDLSFRIPGYPDPVRDMNLHAAMRDGHIVLDSAFLRIGHSDLRLSGSVSDVAAFLRDRTKTVLVTLNASSNKVLLHELLAYDSALARTITEEITGFHIGLKLETTAQQLLSPAPLPKGKFEITNLNARLKNYPHALQGLGATVTINDTALLVRNFAGMIDQTDFRFSGRIKNYQLWFDSLKKGKTQIAFDLKSTRFGMQDVLGAVSRQYIPRGYRKEEASNVWLRAKLDIRYDTVFRFVKAEIVNVTGALKKHAISVEGIRGKVLYGVNRVFVVDTLTGRVGKSDFDVSFRMFLGTDKSKRKKTNMLRFQSAFLDMDEISQYKLAPSKGKRNAAVPVDTVTHAKTFNIFAIPFTDFDVQVDIGKMKYNKLWMKEISAKMRMQEDHHIYIDTLMTKIAGGTVRMRGHLNGSDSTKIYLRSTIKVDQVDLEKVMLKLDHFGQDVVINKNIKGRLSGQVKSYVQIHPNFVPIMSKTKADLNIKIFDGSLVDFAPLQAMASYFKDKNLRLVRFDTLENRISFSNGVLDIPSMDINSSLGFIRMSGKQTLDLNMEYYVRVPMKMVTQVGFNALFAKNDGTVALDQVDEIEYADKDKKVRYVNLKVTGRPEDFKVGLGRDRRQ